MVFANGGPFSAFSICSIAHPRGSRHFLFSNCAYIIVIFGNRVKLVTENLFIKLSGTFGESCRDMINFDPKILGNDFFG